MKLTLKRIAFRDTYTIGRLFIDGAYFCDTLEDRVREIAPDGTGKVWGETAIQAGTYKVIMKQSPKFGRILPRLLDVPHFTGILIHRGNTAKDSHGCILVGKNKVVGKVVESAITEEALVAKLKNERNLSITIQ